MRILTDKTAVFIDNGYLSKVLKYDFNEPKLDYRAFSDLLCGSCERFRTYVYDCPPYQGPVPTDSEKKRKSDSDRFFTALDRLPRFEIRFGRLRKTNSNPPFEQKGVDVLLSVDLVRLSSSNKIDKAILVSGDSDFVPAVRVAKDEGVIVCHGQLKINRFGPPEINHPPPPSGGRGKEDETRSGMGRDAGAPPAWRIGQQTR